jgi:hypothetical protein
VRAVVRRQLDFHGAHPYLAGYVVSEAHTQPERVQTIMRRAGTHRSACCGDSSRPRPPREKSAVSPPSISSRT